VEGPLGVHSLRGFHWLVAARAVPQGRPSACPSPAAPEPVEELCQGQVRHGSRCDGLHLVSVCVLGLHCFFLSQDSASGGYSKPPS